MVTSQAGLSGAQARTAIMQVLQNLRSFALAVEGDQGVALATRAVPASAAAAAVEGTDQQSGPEAVETSTLEQVGLPVFSPAHFVSLELGSNGE